MKVLTTNLRKKTFHRLGGGKKNYLQDENLLYE